MERDTSIVRRFVILNVAGGLLVLASYTLVFWLAPSMRSALWGGVPEKLRGLYTLSMFAAAAGYFPFTWYFVRLLGDGANASWAPTVLSAYRLILFPSAAWLPLTLLYLQRSSPALWMIVRADLLAVAAGALTVLVAVRRSAARTNGALPWIALVGGAAFAWQTVVLDALVWPMYFVAK